MSEKLQVDWCSDFICCLAWKLFFFKVSCLCDHFNKVVAVFPGIFASKQYSNCHERDGGCRQHTCLYARVRTFFSCKIHASRMFGSRADRFCEFLKIVSSLRHVSVGCLASLLYHHRFFSYLFSVMTFILVNTAGTRSLLLRLRSMEWNVWRSGQSDS